MAHLTHKTIIGKGGRLVIPGAIRKALNVREGDAVTLRLEPGGSLSVFTLPQAVAMAQRIVRRRAKPGRSLSGEIIEQRRAEGEMEK